MKRIKPIEKHGCTKFVHMSMFLLIAVISFSSLAKEVLVEPTKETSYIVRKIASTPDEEVLTVPNYDRPLLLSIFTEDDAGIMAMMRKSVSDWDHKEEFTKNWKLENIDIYKAPNESDKRKHILNKLLKYADKRLSGEIRNAEEGSTLHTVGKVEKSLRPNTEVSISKLVSLKFKARVLQGKAIMEVRNPWIDCSTTFAASGTIKVLTKKDFKELGLSSGVEYGATNSEWVAFVDKEISENIKARLSSTQKDQSITNVNADKKIELTANFPFNL
jgi:hypothetical protein